MENPKTSPLPPKQPLSPSAGEGATATAPSPHNRRELPREKPFRRSETPVLRFTPYAWAKLLFFRDAGDTEIGGFGITSITQDDLLLVEDFVTVKQLVSSVTVAFDDTAVADHFDHQVDLHRRPEQFARVWIHSHPGTSASPSGTDEETFGRVFGICDWAIMFILARGGQTYTRLRFNVGPGGEQLLKAEVDFGQYFAGSDVESWSREYEQNVFRAPPALETKRDVRRMAPEESFWGVPDTVGNDVPLDDAEIREALLDEYAEYWGRERGIFDDRYL